MRIPINQHRKEEYEIANMKKNIFLMNKWQYIREKVSLQNSLIF